MSDVLEAIKKRRSIRKYKDTMVPKEIIDKIIEAGTYAATGMGKQSPIIIAVTNKELRDKLSAMNAKIMGKDADPFVEIYTGIFKNPYYRLRNRAFYQWLPSQEHPSLESAGGKWRI